MNCISSNLFPLLKTHFMQFLKMVWLGKTRSDMTIAVMKLSAITVMKLSAMFPHISFMCQQPLKGSASPRQT